MKEKTYYEVLDEMNQNEKDNLQYEILLELGEICFALITRMNRKDTKIDRETDVAINGKMYQITIEETKYGISKIR